MRAPFIVLFLLACTLPARAQDSCSARAVNRALLSAESDWPAACPRPSASELVGAETATALAVSPNTLERRAQLIAAARTLEQAARTQTPWGPAFAQQLEALLNALHPSRCDKPLELSWTALRAPISSCQCAFEVGAVGDAGHACFRFPQAAGAALPACEQPGMQVHDLPDWLSVARAYMFYDLAHTALLALTNKCREAVVARLTQAEQRWHRLVTRGLVQYPWELWLSRLIADDYGNYSRCFASDPKCSGDEGLDPESLRLIFLHPGVGLGFPGFGDHDGQVKAKARLVLTVEALGIAIYDRELKEYLGASLGVGFQDADFARPRLGAFVHLSRYLQVGFLLGVVSETKANGTLYVSTDLLSWANRTLGLEEMLMSPQH
jgi:hypothetical protein